MACRTMDKRRNAALKYSERKLGFFEKKIQVIKKIDTSGKKMDKEKPLGEWDVSPSGSETGYNQWEPY